MTDLTTVLAPTRARARRRPVTAVAIGNEVSKGLLHGWAERWQIVFETVMFIAMLLLLAGLVGQGEAIAEGRFVWGFDPVTTAWLLTGFAGFTFHYLQTQKLFWRLLGELQAGTLEQVYLSPLPSWVVAAAGRVAANVVETVFVVGTLVVAIRLVVPISLDVRFDVVVPLIALLVASVGYSLFIGGLTLRYKRIEVLNDGLHVVVLFSGGVMVPLSQIPGWMAAIGRYMPITHPIEALRTTVVDGAGLSLSGDGGLLWLAATAVGWLLVGAVSFHLGDRAARRAGTLTHY